MKPKIQFAVYNIFENNSCNRNNGIQSALIERKQKFPNNNAIKGKEIHTSLFHIETTLIKSWFISENVSNNSSA